MSKGYYAAIVGTVVGIIGLILSLTANAYGFALFFLIGLSFLSYVVYALRRVLSEENRLDFRG